MEEQEEQETMLSELVDSMGRMVPVIESVKKLADRDLRQTTMAMLELIEDVSVFIVAYRSDGRLSEYRGTAGLCGVKADSAKYKSG